MIDPAVLSLVAALPMPVVLIGPDARILAVNPAAEALIPTSAPGRHHVTALRQPQVVDPVERCLAGEGPGSGRFTIRAGSRDSVWRVSVAPVALASGQGALLSFEDVTATEEAEQMRRDFLANVSHELRTPLTALLGFIETLRGPARDDPVARDRFLGIMEREAARMSQLVRDLLSLSRVEEAERIRPRDQVDLTSLCAGVAEALEPVAAAGRNRLERHLPAEAVEIPGDADQLRQVVTNLVVNAIHYGGSDRPVEITLAGPQDEPLLRGRGVRIVVRDHGEGIAAHHIPRLTERFYRVDTHRSREVGGTGLGLAIVKHIVNRHRGRLLIESRVGEGSRFCVLLPAT